MKCQKKQYAINMNHVNCKFYTHLHTILHVFVYNAIIILYTRYIYNN